MSQILIVGGDPTIMGDFVRVLSQKNGNRISWTYSAREALAIMDREKIDTVVVDENLVKVDGIDLVGEIMKAHPMVNCAVISSLPVAEFHEATEGLGVFMQLPPQPGAQHAEKMLQLLETIEVLMKM